MKDNVLLQVVTDSLSALGVADNTLSKVPTLVKRAIVDLQREDILPPVSIEDNGIELKEEFRDRNGNLVYNYIKLPKDFRKLSEFYVGDGLAPYSEVQHEYYLENISKFNSLRSHPQTNDRVQRVFSLTHLTIAENTAPKPILAVYPFPDNDTLIRIKYHIDGTENSLIYVDENYYSLIVNTVEAYLGLRDPQSIDVTDYSRQWHNRKGKNIINSTMIRTKPNRLFGR